MSLLADTYYNRLHRTSTLVIQIIALTFLSLIYYYLQRLEKENCECALTPQYATLRRLNIVMLSLVGFMTAVTIVMQFVYHQKPSTAVLLILYGIALVTTIIDIVFLIVSLRYIAQLYKIACQCSDNGMRLTYLIYVIIRLALVAISIVFIILLFFFLAYLYMATSKAVSSSAAVRDHTKPKSSAKSNAKSNTKSRR